MSEKKGKTVTIQIEDPFDIGSVTEEDLLNDLDDSNDSNGAAVKIISLKPAAGNEEIEDPKSALELRRVYTLADDQLKSKAEKYLESESLFAKYCNKGNLSNFIAFFLMVIGIVTFEVSKSKNGDGEADEYSKYLLSLGLFSFSGGITNWLAIKMLFDKIPGLIGSGVITREFKNIRENIKKVILEMFFDREFLEEYLGVRAKEIIKKMDIKKMVNMSLSHEKIHPILVAKIQQAKVGKKPFNRLVRTLTSFGTPDQMAKILRPVLSKLASEIVPEVVRNVEIDQLVNLDIIESEINKLMTEKLELLTPELVKKLLERVIREHLGWLVVWGNVFGGLIGVLSQAAGFGS